MNAQWQNAGRRRFPPATHEQSQLVERFDQRGLDRGPTRDLGVEESEDPRFDLVGDAHERGGERRFAPIHGAEAIEHLRRAAPRRGRLDSLRPCPSS